MLARLERCPGIETARTSWSGTGLALDLAPGASRKKALADVASVMGRDYEVTELDGAEDREAIAAIDAGGKWFTKDECFALSAYEAKVLAKRDVKRLRRRVALDAPSAERLERAIEEGWCRFFRRHHEGREVLTTARTHAFWRAERERVIFGLSAEQAAALREVLADD